MTSQPPTEPAVPVAEAALPHVYRVGCPFGDGGVVHVYYVDATEPALIDAGVKASPAETIAPALRAAGFDPAGVRHLFNTHGHWDHMGGNEALREIAPRARTYAHHEDSHLLGDVERHVQGYVTYPQRILGDEEGLLEMAATLRRSVGTPTPVDVVVRDGGYYSLGEGVALRAIHTPGHSRGSTSYLLEGTAGEGALFTGDAVQGLGSRPGQLPLVFDDSHAYRATIAKLASVSFAAMCLGHSYLGLGPDAGRDPVRKGEAARAFLEESGEAAKAIEEAMRSVLASDGDRGFLLVAEATLARVAGSLGVQLDARGLNTRSLATLHAFYRELTGAPPPA
jgi:hydroxyacylglutathione hydrolase